MGYSIAFRTQIVQLSTQLCTYEVDRFCKTIRSLYIICILAVLIPTDRLSVTRPRLEEEIIFFSLQ